MPIRIFFLGLIVLMVDQATKALILQLLHTRPSLPILSGIFHLTLVRNPGVAFGLFSGYSLPVAMVTTVILLGLIWRTLSRGGSHGFHPTLSLGLILGGAMGNLVDRIREGVVIDFLDFRIWPVFNVADACITIGAALMAWDLLRRR